MPAEIHPAARRITWLVVVTGAVAVLIACAYFVFNLGTGIALPLTRTPLDIGWLLIAGAIWLAIGLIMLWWLRPGTAVQIDRPQTAEKQEKQLQPAEDTRLAEFESHLATLASQIAQFGARLDAMEAQLKTARTRAPARSTGQEINSPHDLDNELGSLATAIQDIHTRLDGLGDVNDRLNDLESQLDTLYVTLQDAHRRIDSLEQVNSR